MATNGALRNRLQRGPAVPLPRKLQPASRKAGTCLRKRSTSPMTSRTGGQGTERRAETAVFERLFCRRMHHYRVLAKNTYHRKSDVIYLNAETLGWGWGVHSCLPR